MEAAFEDFLANEVMPAVREWAQAAARFVEPVHVTWSRGDHWFWSTPLMEHRDVWVIGKFKYEDTGYGCTVTCTGLVGVTTSAEVFKSFETKEPRFRPSDSPMWTLAEAVLPGLPGKSVDPEGWRQSLMTCLRERLIAMANDPTTRLKD